MKGINGVEMIEMLQSDILSNIEDYDWDPHGLTPNDFIKLVEVKSHLINAEAKLQSILEGIDET